MTPLVQSDPGDDLNVFNAEPLSALDLRVLRYFGLRRTHAGTRLTADLLGVWIGLRSYPWWRRPWFLGALYWRLQRLVSRDILYTCNSGELYGITAYGLQRLSEGR